MLITARKSCQKRALFHRNWKLVEQHRQRNHIANHVVRKETKDKIRSKEMQTFHYLFTVNKIRIKLRKALFLKILEIGEKNLQLILCS